MTGWARAAALAAAAAATAAGTMEARAACATDAEIAAYVADYQARTPTKALSAGGDMADALCTQEKLVAALSEIYGPVVGYKAGLTSKPAQERFGASEPVRGVLLEAMLLEDGAEAPADFGARPLFEADLLLLVGDAAINEAATPEEAMAHIASVIPFIELPDLMLAEGEPVDSVTLTAMSVGARLGVMGAGVPVEDPAAMLAALEAMTVRVTAADGEVLAEAPGAAVLGNPVNSLLWLRDKGVVFKPGDLVSVGSIGPLLPIAKAKGAVSATYEGLPGDPSAHVIFK